MEQTSRLWIGGVIAVLLGAAVFAVTARAPQILPPEAEKARSDAKAAAAEAEALKEAKSATAEADQKKEPIGKELEDTKGVIKPPKGIDPDIHVPAPEGGTMKVIVPPGEPGGDPMVQPK